MRLSVFCLLALAACAPRAAGPTIVEVFRTVDAQSQPDAAALVVHIESIVSIGCEWHAERVDLAAGALAALPADPKVHTFALALLAFNRAAEDYRCGDWAVAAERGDEGYEAARRLKAIYRASGRPAEFAERVRRTLVDLRAQECPLLEKSGIFRIATELDDH